MGKNIKLLTTRGIIALILTLAIVYLFVTDTTKHITEFITMYMVIINYLFGTRENGDKSNE